tara:strand:- start:311 stop:592 length:282 start_codon:yes stop_codon:yes gene_type:complete
MNTPKNAALILDIRIKQLKERGDSLIHRSQSRNQSKTAAKAFEKLWSERERLVQARWDMVPKKYRKWCDATADAANTALLQWHRDKKNQEITE